MKKQRETERQTDGLGFREIKSQSLNDSVCVCVGVCVCERERERERELIPTSDEDIKARSHFNLFPYFSEEQFLCPKITGC